MSNLSTQIIVGGRAEQALDAMMKTANAVRETARIAGASAREQYDSYQLAIRGIREEQEASEASLRQKIADSARAQAIWQREKNSQWQAADAQQATARAQELASLKADILARSQSEARTSADAYVGTLRMLGLESKAAAESQQMLGESVGFSGGKMGYASASVRTLEGHIGTNTRAVERFISETLGLAPVLEAAFPIVGAVALVGMLVELAKKAYDAFQNIYNLKSAIEGLDKAEITVTQRVKQEHDQAERSYEDVLEKGPGGHEAALRQKDKYDRAQPLDTSAYFYSAEFKSLQNDVKGNFETMYKSVAPSDIPARLKAITQGAKDLQAAADYWKDPNSSENASKSMGDFASVDIGGHAFAPSGLRSPGQYFSATAEAARQIQAQLEAESTARSMQNQATGGDVDSAHRKGIEDAQRKAAEAARAAQEAQRKADADHLRALQEELELRKSSMPMRPYETQVNYEQRQRTSEIGFYAAHAQDFAPGTDQYKSILVAQQKLIEDYNKVDSEGRGSLSRMLASSGPVPSFDAIMGTDKDREHTDKAKRDALAAQQQLSFKLQESRVSQDLQTGSVSRYDAAVQLAALHTQSYQVALEKLRDQSNAIATDKYLNAEQRKGQLIGVDSDVELLRRNYQAQAIQDQLAISTQTGLGSWRETLNQFVQQSQDTAAQVREIWTSALGSVNEELVKIMTTRHNYGLRREWGNLGAGMFKNVAGSALQHAEGTLLGGLGFGKPDGSSSNPLYVRMAGAVGTAASGIGGMVRQVFGGNNTQSGGSAAGGFIAGLGKIVSGLGFAEGGQPPVGVASLVGESGPEMFVPKVAGTVIPNDQIGGVTHNHHWNIDARGAADPAAVNTAVQRGIAKAMPTIVSTTIRAHQDANSRLPPSRRR